MRALMRAVDPMCLAQPGSVDRWGVIHPTFTPIRRMDVAFHIHRFSTTPSSGNAEPCLN